MSSKGYKTYQLKPTLYVEAHCNCPVCYGQGFFEEARPWGSTVAYEQLGCDDCYHRAVQAGLITDEEAEQYDSGELEILMTHYGDKTADRKWPRTVSVGGRDWEVKK